MLAYQHLLLSWDTLLEVYLSWSVESAQGTWMDPQA